MQRNPWASLLLPFLILLGGLAMHGCDKKNPSVVVEKGEPLAGSTFLAAAKSVTVTAASAERLGDLHLSGLALIVIALVARLLFGTWKDAFCVSILGLVPSVGAVLLTDFPAVALLIPACGLALLTLWILKRIHHWRVASKAWAAVATEIEGADTGPKSEGQRIKNRFKEAGLATVLDPALKPLEAKWVQTKTT